MEQAREKSLPAHQFLTVRSLIRGAIFCLGMFTVALGIVLCVKCNLGISPISSIPFVFSLFLPLSFGALTRWFLILNSAAQYFMERSWRNIKVLLQIPYAFVFGAVVDLLKNWLPMAEGIAESLLFLAGSVFFTALGMTLMVNMRLVQNPPDGTVRDLSLHSGIEMGKMKIIYDILCVVLSLLVSFLALGRLTGFGVATIVSAIFVGRTLTLLQGSLGTLLRKYVMQETE